MSRAPLHRLLPALVALVTAGVVASSPAALAGPPAQPAGHTPGTAQLSRPAAADPAAHGATAAIGGVVPGLTGQAAQQAAGPAAARFKQSTLDRLNATAAAGTARPAAPAAPAAQLHTDWGVNLPTAQGQGLHATQSVLTGVTTTTGGDYVYAPTALPGGNACIEMTTAYTPSGPDLWAWDWCGGRDGVGKLTPMNASFLATYTTVVNGHAAYSMDEHKTSTTANTWTAYLYNYQTKVWDSYFTSTGTYDLPQFAFGWNMFEVYTTVNPATGAGYYCGNLTGEGFESSGVQVQTSAGWVAATPSNSSASTPPAGSRLDCPSLAFTLVHPNDNWRAQIGTTTTPPPATHSFEAEATANTFGGQAAVRSSTGASGGALVGYVGNGTANYLQINNITGSTAGSHTVTLYYTSGENRSVTLSANGGTGVTVSTPSSGGWDTVRSVTATLTLTAGTNTIRLSNTTGWAPDLDRIVIS